MVEIVSPAGGFRRGIAIRFIIYILLFSTAVTLIGTSLELYLDYSRDIASIRSRLHRIETSDLQGLIMSLWVSDRQFLDVQLEGILRLPDIEYLEIEKDGRVMLSLGELKSSHMITEQYPLYHDYKNNRIHLGTLNVVAGLDGVYSRLLQKLTMTLASQAVKALIAALFIFMIFYRLVGKPLAALAESVRDMDAETMDAELVLRRSAGRFFREDELDQLVVSINEMRQKLKKSFADVWVTNKRLLLEMANREQTDKALKESEKRFRQLAEHIQEVFWIVSPDWNRVRYISPAYETIWGKSCESLYENPQSWLDSVAEEDREKVLSYIDQKRQGDLSDIVFPEYRIIRPDGSHRWIMARGVAVYDEESQVDRVIGIAVDITEQKQTQKDIQALVESTVGIIGQDLFDAVVHKLCEWFGCECAVVGEFNYPSSFRVLSMELDGNLIHEGSYDIAGTACEQICRGGFFACPEAVRERFPDDGELARIGAEGYMAMALVDRQGDVMGAVCAMSRKTLHLPARAEEVVSIIAGKVSAEIEHKHMEEEKARMGAQLRQSQKMEAIGTLAGGIAHDFNNILFPILGYTEMIMDDLPKDSRHRRFMNEILKAAIRAKELVQQILTFSRDSEQKYQPLKVQHVLKEALKLIRSTIPTSIDIRQNISMKCGPVMADPTQIHQIVMNLCTNAYQAMEEQGGRMDVTLSQVTLSPDDQKGLSLPAGNYILLTVSDTGHGMEPAVIHRMFDPYFTTKPTGKGTGLGLSVVHGIVKQYGGEIRVHSSPGQGSRFEVYLPLIDTVHDTAGKTLPEAVPGGHERILLVDDELQIVRMEREMLERLGYQVTTETSSTGAFNRFTRQPDAFDLVISDMTMPTMTGLDLAEKLIGIRADIPIILCTGFSESVNEDKAKAAGIRGYVMKPVEKRDIAVRIRSVLDGS